MYAVIRYFNYRKDVSFTILQTFKRCTYERLAPTFLLELMNMHFDVQKLILVRKK